MAHLVDIYRQEIIESEKVRADFMKWKMIMVGAIGSAGLGLIGTISHTDTEIILCIIPLTCLYLDLLCYQQSLRVFVIAKFIIDTDGIEPMNKSYEWLCRRTHKAHFFMLEDIALSWSTIVSSILLITLMIIIKLFRVKL